MDLHDYLRLLRRAWLQIITITLVFFGLAALYLVVVPTTYESSTALFVSANGPLTIEDLQGGTEFSAKAVTSYADIVSSATVLAPASGELGSSVEDLQSKVISTAPEDTRIIDITVTDHDPDRAAQIANAVARDAVRILPTLEGTPDGRPLVAVSQLRPAVAQPDSAAPGTDRVLAIGIVVGLCVALGVALVRQALDSRVRRAEDLRALTDTPALARVPAARRRANPIVVRDDSTSPEDEAYRSLRTNLRFLEAVGRRSLLFTAVGSEDRDSAAVPANLAYSLAQAGRRVLLVDLDLRGHAIASALGFEPSAGVVDILTDDVDPASLLHFADQSRVSVLLSGLTTRTPSDLLSSPKMARLLRQMEREFDYVIMHAPPVEASSDAAVVASISSATFLTVDFGRSKAPEVSNALESLANVQVSPAGIVLIEQHRAAMLK